MVLSGLQASFLQASWLTLQGKMTLFPPSKSCLLVSLHDLPTCNAWCTMRFGSAATVLAKCKLKYYRISECGVQVWLHLDDTSKVTQIEGVVRLGRCW